MSIGLPEEGTMLLSGPEGIKEKLSLHQKGMPYRDWASDMEWLLNEVNKQHKLLIEASEKAERLLERIRQLQSS